MRKSGGWSGVLGSILFSAAVIYGLALGLTVSPALEHGVMAQNQGNVPGDALGNRNDTDFWRQIRRGAQGKVSIPDPQAGVMIQSEGNNWRALRNGPISIFGGWALFGTIGVLALFFVLRGRIRIDAGPSGKLIERFNGVERFAHWLVANSFILLALSGLNTMYGRYFLKPLIGAEYFSTLTIAGKYIHNFVAFAFMAGLVFILVLWVRHNVPNRLDLKWLMMGGGILAKGVHPPARKFNLGQKLLFWVVIIGGLSISVSGIALLFPFEVAMFAGTAEFLNLFGFDFPTTFTALQETQLSQLWHAIVGLGMIALIIAHIYIGTAGMEGAFDAMGTGMVDENWAREHHSLWVEEQEQKKQVGDD
jgi:formate dehydrogenase subunit gamma